MRLFTGLLLLVVLPLEAAEPTAKVEEQTIKVLEAFDVGRGVVVRSLAVEKSADSLWVGTSVGVNEIDLKTYNLKQTLTRTEGLANEYVFAIMVDSQGYKWFGTNGGGVSRYRKGTWKTYFPMHGLADYWVYSFAEGLDDKIWIGTWAGINQLQPADHQFKTYVKEPVNEWVYGAAVDSKGRLWFGTEGGVSRFDGENWKSWTHKDGVGAANDKQLPLSKNTGLGTRSRHNLSTMTQGSETYNPNYIFSIVVDEKDGVWVGTWGGGVSYFDGLKWKSYTSQQGLAGDIVFSMAQQEGGFMWFGTNHGLSRFDGHRWKTFSRSDGLPAENIYAVAVNGEEIWAGGQGMVARLGIK